MWGSVLRPTIALDCLEAARLKHLIGNQIIRRSRIGAYAVGSVEGAGRPTWRPELPSQA